ncbi:Lamin Tail Domain [Lutibacter agarilyticus]|uniref:Lamin Tail Domain n=1 Tax=Lutibacter agarilyticus TaxID=1109740 RepID=A0A238VW94_9FLAO|nr:DUF5689 domain-containing protein [Lutibacter agarilyticus]SNR38556.1 Lamin Tail Domain [Lutibacter agarilyticus]
MKTTKSIYKYLKLLFLFCLFSACVKDQDFSTPTIECSEPEIRVTNTIQQVKEMYRFGGATVIETDVVIEGYVVSNDEAGNIYKTLSIQDKPENPTAAIKISIDKTDLYTKYNLGRKIYVKLKGLAVGYSYGSFQIGKANGKELVRIPLTEVNNYIARSCEVVEIVPKKVKISELNEDFLEMFIQLENVQFATNELGQSYGNLDNSSTVERVLESFNNDCNLLNNIKLRNSGFADFKNELLPEGKGTINAILSNYYDDFQLYIRSVDDVNLTEDRCDYSNALIPTISIKEVREMYTGSMVEFGVETKYVIEGYVVSSDEQGNFEGKLVIQDAIENPSAGIHLLIEKEMSFEHYNIGDKVFVTLNKLYMNENDDVLTIGFPKNDEITEIEEEAVSAYIYNTGENFQMHPKEITLSEINNPLLESILVKVLNVQLVENELGSAFTYFTGTDDGIRAIETCNETNKLTVFTNGNATFSNELFPEGKGSITGILNSNIEIRYLDDVQFTGQYEICPVIIPNILITEVADPKNSTTSRFVELYNAGSATINLTGWKLNKYVNGASSVSGTAVDLTGIKIPSKRFVIIANTGFATIFGITPTIETTYISGNGDDVYELIDNSGKTIDIFGVIGEDGNGTNWEYLDGSAVRKLDVNNANNSFNINEWIVSSNANNMLISYPNTPKNAPNDLSPNYR